MANSTPKATKMTRPSSAFLLLRTLSLRIPSRVSPSPVAPLPLRTAFDRWLSTELKGLLRRSPSQQYSAGRYTSAAWIIHALDVAVATQKMAVESIISSSSRDDGYGLGRCDRNAVDGYMEDIVELLDACNSLRDRIETVRNYIESLAIAAHCLSVGPGRDPNGSAFARAEAALGPCEVMERRCAEFDKCGSSLRKLGEKIAQGGAICMAGGPCNYEMGSGMTELDEALSGSKAIGLLVCGMLSISLSFKSKRGLPMTQSRQSGSWSTSLHQLHKEVKEEVDKRRKNGGVVLDELRWATLAAQKLRALVSRGQENDDKGGRDVRDIVAELERSCGELEDGIKVFEGRVNELYKQMISIRMALLGLVTAAS